MVTVEHLQQLNVSAAIQKKVVYSSETFNSSYKQIGGAPVIDKFFPYYMLDYFLLLNTTLLFKGLPMHSNTIAVINLLNFCQLLNETRFKHFLCGLRQKEQNMKDLTFVLLASG